jgi:hypothetical protein
VRSARDLLMSFKLMMQCSLRGRRVAAGEELLDRGEEPVGIGEPGHVVGTVNFEQPSPGDVVRYTGPPAPERHRGHE